jgi:hypothetical protein
MTGYEKKRRRIFNRNGAFESKVRGKEGGENKKKLSISLTFSPYSPLRSISLLFL